MREKGYGEPDLVAGAAKSPMRPANWSHPTSLAASNSWPTSRRRYGPSLGSTRSKVNSPALSCARTRPTCTGSVAALFDNLELIWDYDALADHARSVKAPQLWVLAEEDREAPPASHARAGSADFATKAPTLPFTASRPPIMAWWNSLRRRWQTHLYARNRRLFPAASRLDQGNGRRDYTSRARKR